MPNGNEAKRKRRVAAGDADPTVTHKSNSTAAGSPPAQPIPFAPQGKGNSTNYAAMEGAEGNFGQQIGGRYSFPYGDGGLPEKEARSRGMDGVVGPLSVSGEVQGFGSMMGRGNNQGFNSHQAPDAQSMEMMYPMSLADSAMKASMKLNGKDDSGAPVPPPYVAGPLGMMPFPGPLDGGQPIGGGIDPRQPNQMFDTLGLQGMPSVEAATQGTGLNTGRGQRNAPSKGGKA